MKRFVAAQHGHEAFQALRARRRARRRLQTVEYGVAVRAVELLKEGLRYRIGRQRTTKIGWHPRRRR